MLGNSIKYAEKAEESRQVGKIKKVLTAQATEFIPSYYAVLYYGKSFAGWLLKPEAYRKRWDREEVIKTHSFIRIKIESYFGDIPTFWFTNRHGDYEDALLELLGKSDQSEIPINIKEVGMRALKLLLLELCIREAKWVGKHPNSLKLQRVPIEEFSQTFDYGLKDITKLDDFNQVVDWQNSSFYQATNQSSSFIS